jgi:hypothetical protein
VKCSIRTLGLSDSAWYLKKLIILLRTSSGLTRKVFHYAKGTYDKLPIIVSDIAE